MTFLITIKYGFINFWRNFWLSIASTLIMVITLFTISTLIILNILANVAITDVQKKVDVSVYLNSNIKEARITEIKSDLEAMPSVVSVGYISKDEALKQFKEEHKDDPVILESLGELDENPLEPTLVVKAEEPEDYAEIADVLRSDKYKKDISEVNYEDNRVVIDRLTNITRNIQRAGFVVGGIFIVIAIIVVFNTIRLTIYTYKEEIGIMKLVGASNAFVRGQFVIEGMIYGVLGALVTLAVLYPVLNAVSPKIASMFEGRELDLAGYFSANMWFVALGLIIVGVALGILSSAIAITRYLRK